LCLLFVNIFVAVLHVCDYLWLCFVCVIISVICACCLVIYLWLCLLFVIIKKIILYMSRCVSLIVVFVCCLCCDVFTQVA